MIYAYCGLDLPSSTKVLNRLIEVGIGVAIITVLSFSMDFFYGEDELKYEVLITDFEEVEKNGYKIVEHKGDNIYIVEKIGKEETDK